MENLTKENFFNALQEQYPDAMKHFCAWIDQYKADNNWLKLFNAGIGYLHTWQKGNGRGGETRTTAAPKFHELPFAMQYGIMTEYLASLADTELEVKEIITEAFVGCLQLHTEELTLKNKNHEQTHD